jgi:hypothetical protein
MRRKIKLVGSDYRDQLNLLIATGGVKVTRCPEFERRNLNPRRAAGMMPAHLNPLTMGDTLEEASRA